MTAQESRTPLKKISRDDLAFGSVPLSSTYINRNELGTVESYAPTGANAYVVMEGNGTLVQISFYKISDS
jgi:hypothetical protein